MTEPWFNYDKRISLGISLLACAAVTALGHVTKNPVPIISAGATAFSIIPKVKKVQKIIDQYNTEEIYLEAIQEVGYEKALEEAIDPTTTIEAQVTEQVSQYRQIEEQIKSELITEEEAAEFIDLKDPRKLQLFRELNTPETSWLLQLIIAVPVNLIGAQGSGKSTFAQYLLLLRRIFLNLDVEVVDPHAHQNSWVSEFKVYGHYQNFDLVKERIKAFIDRQKYTENDNKSRKPTSIIVFDETSTYAEGVDDPKLMTKLMKGVMTEASKTGTLVVIITHGDTNAMFGNAKGMSKVREEGMVKVFLHSINDKSKLGKKTPKLTGHIVGLQTDPNTNEPLTQHINLLPFMQPEYLLERFPELDGSLYPNPPMPKNFINMTKTDGSSVEVTQTKPPIKPIKKVVKSFPTQLTEEEIDLLREIKNTMPKEDAIKRVLDCSKHAGRYKAVQEQFDDIWFDQTEAEMFEHSQSQVTKDFEEDSSSLMETTKPEVDVNEKTVYNESNESAIDVIVL